MRLMKIKNIIPVAADGCSIIRTLIMRGDLDVNNINPQQVPEPNWDAVS